MNTLTLHLFSHRSGRLAPGLALTAIIALFSMWLGQQPAVAALGLGVLTLAILGGMLVGNTLYPAQDNLCSPGVLRAKQTLLRLGIILYGFRLTIQQIADVGASGLIIDLMTLSSTFMLACWLGCHVLKLDRETSWLIGAGSSICGAAAILATEPVVKADAAKVTVAIATVVIFGTLAIFIYPALWPLVQQWWPQVSAADYGIFTGSTLHEVAQVVAAGHAIGPEAENAAVIAKMLRVMMLAPFLLLLGGRLRCHTTAAEGERARIVFPWFALLFVGVALFNSLHLLPTRLINDINSLDNLLLAMAMAALGLTTRFRDLKRAGLRPLALGLLLFCWLLFGGGSINLLVHHLMT